MTPLETEILDWIAERTDDDSLKQQLSSVEVVRRDYVRTGYFIYLQPDRSIAPVEGRPVIPNPFIDSSELPDGAGCSLFLKDGFVHYLEVYARGGFFPQQLTNYTLRPDD
jgi:hypothetical protein